MMLRMVYRQLIYEQFRTFLTVGSITSSLAVILWLEVRALRGRKYELYLWLIDPVCGVRINERTATV
jgi:hypothetical protein